MTQAEEIKLLKSRVSELETMMLEVTQTLGIGRVDDAALEAAMLRMLSGDNSALDRYLRRGGKIPKGIAA